MDTLGKTDKSGREYSFNLGHIYNTENRLEGDHVMISFALGWAPSGSLGLKQLSKKTSSVSQSVKSYLLMILII